MDTLQVDRVLTSDEITLILGATGTLKDDDPSTPTRLPSYLSLSQFVKDAYKAAYIHIVVLAPQFNPTNTVVFDVNLTDFEVQTGQGYDDAQNVWSSEGFWAALLVVGYQPGENADQDSDPLLGDNANPRGTNFTPDQYIQVGICPEDSDNASVVFLEVMRDMGADAGKDLNHTIAHEVGHSAGDNTSPAQDHAELGIMTDGAPNSENAFSAATLKRFREANPW